jgi:5-methylcytosine-specific restriction endonuclease McrA
MARQSQKGKERAAQLSRVKSALLKRANYRCELCGNRDERLDLHHVFGRSGLGAWNDALECVACLCRPCLVGVTNAATPLQHLWVTELQNAASERLMWRVEDEGLDGGTGLIDPSNRARELVARLNAAGIEP